MNLTTWATSGRDHRAWLGILMLATVTACGGGGSPSTPGVDPVTSPTSPCSPTGAIEGGGRQKLSGPVFAVTAGGDITVGDVRVAASRAEVFVDGSKTTLDAIGTGQVVTLKGEFDLPHATGCASEVVDDAAIAGTIDSIDVEHRTLTILGQSIRVAEDAVFGGGLTLDGLHVGDRIRVSAVPATGALYASRVDPAAFAEGYLVSGIVTGLDSVNRKFLINSILVEYHPDSLIGPVGGLRDGIAVRAWGINAEVDSSAGSTIIRPSRVDLMDFGISIDPSPASLTPGSTMQFIAWGITGAVSWSVSGSDGSACRAEDCGTIDSNGRYTAPSVVTPAAGVLVTAASSSDTSLRASAVVRVTQTPGVETGTYVLTGEAFSAAGRIADAAVDIWVQRPGAGYSYWWVHGPLYTDSSGMFRAPELPDSRVSVWVAAAGYVQPCAVSGDISGDTAVRVELIPEQALDSMTPPRPTLATAPELSGEIYETTDQGRQPVTGARVWLEDPLGITYATTLSDRGGRYYVCNFGQLPTLAWLTVSKPGYELRSVGPVDPQATYTMDIELTRQ